MLTSLSMSEFGEAVGKTGPLSDWSLRMFRRPKSVLATDGDGVKPAAKPYMVLAADKRWISPSSTRASPSLAVMM